MLGSLAGSSQTWLIREERGSVTILELPHHCWIQAERATSFSEEGWASCAAYSDWVNLLGSL